MLITWDHDQHQKSILRFPNNTYLWTFKDNLHQANIWRDPKLLNPLILTDMLWTPPTPLKFAITIVPPPLLSTLYLINKQIQTCV